MTISFWLCIPCFIISIIILVVVVVVVVVVVGTWSFFKVLLCISYDTWYIYSTITISPPCLHSHNDSRARRSPVEASSLEPVTRQRWWCIGWPRNDGGPSTGAVGYDMLRRAVLRCEVVVIVVDSFLSRLISIVVKNNFILQQVGMLQYVCSSYRHARAN